MLDGRTAKVGALYAGGVAGALGLMVGLMGVASRQGPIALGALTLAAAGVGLVFAGMAWRRTDEVAREAHKFAGFWGAPFGVLAALLAAPFVAAMIFHIPTLPHPALPGRAAGAADLVFTGMLITALAQVAGYGLAWAGWWLLRR